MQRTVVDDALTVDAVTVHLRGHAYHHLHALWRLDSLIVQWSVRHDQAVLDRLQHLANGRAEEPLERADGPVCEQRHHV